MGKGDILRKHLCGAASSEFPKEKREHGLRCVLYEMVVLALALVQLKKKAAKFKDATSGKELPFGEEQTAHEAASMTCRVLIEFLYPKVKKSEDTSTPRKLAKLYKSLNKWSFHLTWKRVEKSKGYPQSYPEELLKHGPEVLSDANSFVEECVNKYNYRLTSPNARPYYNKFLELYEEIVDA